MWNRRSNPARRAPPQRRHRAAYDAAIAVIGAARGAGARWRPAGVRLAQSDTLLPIVYLRGGRNLPVKHPGLMSDL